MNAEDFDPRGQLGRVLAGDLSLDEFREWFANALWAAESDADDDTLNLAYLVENHIAELSGGHITEKQLIEALRKEFDAWQRPVDRTSTSGLPQALTLTSAGKGVG